MKVQAPLPLSKSPEIAGAELPTLLSYAVEKRLATRPEEFGRGAIEGVAGPEAANNASAAGTLVPLLTLGLPTSATAAVLLAAFQQFGLQPGPLLFEREPGLVWGVIASLYVGNVMLLVLNLPLVRLWVKLLAIPRPQLYAGILVVATLGAYSVHRSTGDLVLLTAIGVLGYLLLFGDRQARARAGVLGRVLDRLDRAEVDGRFDGRRAPADPRVDDVDVDHSCSCRRTKGITETALEQHGRVDAVRKATKVGNRCRRVVCDLLELRRDLGVVDPRAEELELDLDCHQPLLGAVVEVAFDLPTFCLTGGDDPATGRQQLGRLRLELGLEATALQREQHRLARGLHQLGVGFQCGVMDDVRGR